MGPQQLQLRGLRTASANCPCPLQRATLRQSRQVTDTYCCSVPMAFPSLSEITRTVRRTFRPTPAISSRLPLAIITMLDCSRLAAPVSLYMHQPEPGPLGI